MDNTIQMNISKKDELVLEQYKELKINAEINYENDIEDSLISYYGGLDVTIQSTEDYLYESLVKHIEDSHFMKKMMPLFFKDFPNYIDKQIDICEHALYMIENQDKYYRLAELDELIFSFSSDFEQLEMLKSEIIKEKNNFQIQLNNILKEYKNLSNQKYNIFDLINRKKKNDKIKLHCIQEKINNISSELNEIDNKLKEIELEWKQLEKEKKEYKKEKVELASNLEREFEDFTLNPDLDDRPYIKEEYYLKVSLDRLIEKEDEYIEKLAQLKQSKIYAIENLKNLDEEINKIDDINYDIVDITEGKN